MKKLFAIGFLLASFGLVGCSQMPTYTYPDSKFASDTKISNYDRITVDGDFSVQLVNEDMDSKVVNLKTIETMFKASMKKKGVAVTISDEADYVIRVKAIHRTEQKHFQHNHMASNLATTTQGVTGSASAGAAALGVGMIANALKDKRKWLIAFDIDTQGKKHTEFRMLAFPETSSEGLNNTVGLSASEFFELKK